MRDIIKKMQSFVSLRALPFSVIALLALPMPVSAQATSNDASAQPEGHIIYSRDVPYGSAVEARSPGKEHIVVTGPTRLLIDVVAIGLKPISDTENAGITSQTNPQMGIVSSQLALGLGALSSTTAGRTNAGDIGGMQGSTSGGAIGTATGAIGNAMGTLRGVLGGGQ